MKLVRFADATGMVHHGVLSEDTIAPISGDLFGPRVLKRLAFPLFILFFMLPLPLAVIAEVSLRMKLFATQVALGLLGAVGVLQFEVFKYRLENEYGATARLEPAPYKIIRWVDESGGAASVVTESMMPPSCRLLLDSSNRKVMLFDSEWIVKFFCERNPDVCLHALPAAIKRA